jgi:hypothetical protein
MLLISGECFNYTNNLCADTLRINGSTTTLVWAHNESDYWAAVAQSNNINDKSQVLKTVSEKCFDDYMTFTCGSFFPLCADDGASPLKMCTGVCLTSRASCLSWFKQGDEENALTTCADGDPMTGTSRNFVYDSKDSMCFEPENSAPPGATSFLMPSSVLALTLFLLLLGTI